MDNFLVPLITKYASQEMIELYTEQNTITLWRILWISLAKAQKELDINITDEQINELIKNLYKINLQEAHDIEKKIGHDVMSQIQHYSNICPLASKIIHLGATSCYVKDNADLIIYYDSLIILKNKLIVLLKIFLSIADQNKNVETLSYTHLQAAQLTTVGKRFALWMQDFYIDFCDLIHILENYMLRGAKGTTGTQASFLKLLGSVDKVLELDKVLLQKLGFKNSFTITNQTYTRKFDYKILTLLSGICQSAHKFATDIRILQNFKEISENFDEYQVGSSAMAYKRNPILCERICGISRFVISLPINSAMNTSLQWLERTLDDSANKKIVMNNAFFATDSVLELMIKVLSKIKINSKIIEKNLNKELPYMITENILMEGVNKGGDRQLLHDRIRTLSMLSYENVINNDENNLIELIKKDKIFKNINIDKIIQNQNFAGISSSQVDIFLNEVRENTSFNDTKIDSIISMNKNFEFTIDTQKLQEIIKLEKKMYIYEMEYKLAGET